MFQFTSFASLILYIQIRMTRVRLAGFPHSEIFGSKLDWQLTEAYSSLLLPSSPPDTKAFTRYPFQLSTNYYSSIEILKTQFLLELYFTNMSKNTSYFLSIIYKRHFFKNMVEVSGVEPLAFRVQNGRSTNWAIPPYFTFNCWYKMVGLSRFERLTSPLSAGCSNQLSYRPAPFI